MRDTTHLVALQTRLSHERAYLATAKKENEIALRKVWIRQIEKEIADEMAFCGIDPTVPDMTDDELFAELGL
jgi:hypothetical protein